MKNPKIYNDNTWTEARFRSFVMSALRKARWPLKYKAIKAAYVGDGENPATGRKCKLHKCVECGELFPAKDMQADHIEPVIPLDGDWGDAPTYLGYDWNQVIARLFCDVDNFQAICKGCHKIKSAEERKVRAEFKKKKSAQEELF